MDIHKPKAAHSWREFLIEIGTIICGILIALGLEQGIEWVHWREAVEASREGLRRELALNNAYYAERQLASACIDERIAQVASLIERVAKTGVSPKAENVAPILGSRIETAEWEAQRAAQTLVHFNTQERALFSAEYVQTQDYIRWRDREGEAWGALRVLDGPPKRFSDSDLNMLRIQLITAKTMARLWNYNVPLSLRRGEALGVPVPHTTGWIRQRNCVEVRTW
jgi:hypothetical protein